MKVLLGKETRDENVTILLVKDLDPNKALSCHYSFHKPKVKAPDHNNGQNYGKGRHHDPILNIAETENVAVNFIINPILIIVNHTRRCIDLISTTIPMILFQKGVEEQCQLSKCNEQYEETNIPANHGKKLGRAQLFTLDIQVVIGATVLAVDLLGPHNLSCDAVRVMLLMLAVARLYVLGVDSKEF